MNFLERTYPDHWASWSPLRRVAETERHLASEAARRRRDAAIGRLEQRRKKIEAEYEAALEAAARRYQEYED